MKKFKLYMIKNSFANAFQDEKINVFLELFTRAKDNKFCQQQLDLIVESIDKERLKELLINRFENRKDFTLFDDYYHLENVVSETEEKLMVFNDHLELEYKAKRSQFYEFLTIFYPNLFYIDENNEKITMLRLVNP